jgi:hypothetical protein
MAAPPFVPASPTHHPRRYQSPPRRDDEWWLDRPGDLPAGQPDVDAGRMGAPGPDQGYVLKLLPVLRSKLHLQAGEQLAAVERGAVAVALKRASLFGRAPVIHDLRVAYTVWGFLDPDAPGELVDERRRRFEGVHHTAAHYAELRAVADAVPAAVLRGTPGEVENAYRSDWRSQLELG